MSEAFPALVATTQAAVAIDGVAPDVPRMAGNVRPVGGVYDMLPSVGACPAIKSVQRLFTNGSAIDMTVDGSSTAQVFSIKPTANSLSISGVGLEMITSNNIVFNGTAFGGRYYTAGILGVIAAGYYAPAGLTKGLQLQLTSAGVTTQLANFMANEDFVASQIGASGGSLTGTTDTLRCRFEMRQPLVMGTSDQLFWTVRDNMTNNQGIVELRSYAWGQTTS